ncbi:hypothetical protein HZS_3272 [Henneguya salminicola]|nr:hypothetical protein HZS_3272 [Henneguya salminicola]
MAEITQPDFKAELNKTDLPIEINLDVQKLILIKHPNLFSCPPEITEFPLIPLLVYRLHILNLNNASSDILIIDLNRDLLLSQFTNSLNNICNSNLHNNLQIPVDELYKRVFLYTPEDIRDFHTKMAKKQFFSQIRKYRSLKYILIIGFSDYIINDFSTLEIDKYLKKRR